MTIKNLGAGTAFYAAFIFCLGYLLFFPVPYYLFPDVGTWTAPVIKPAIEFIGKNVIRLQKPFTPDLWSDTTGHYIFVISLFILSVFAGLIISAVRKGIVSPKLKFWFFTALTYYLSLTLLKYGADKIFKHQFYIPEPNTLFTPLGQLTPDTLFWSTMGSSYSYTVFGGIMEIIPALLLLFRRTRLPGILISIGVLLNVVMLNFGFDITVKLYSLFLLFVSLLLLTPHLPQLISFFFKKEPATGYTEQHINLTRKSLPLYVAAKSLVLGLLIYESTGYYFATHNFNDDLAPRPELYGAYEVYLFTDQGKIIPASTSHPGRFRRIFFHSRDYFIVQTMADEFVDFKVQINPETETIELDQGVYQEKPQGLITLNYKVNEDKLVLYGYFNDTYITLFSKKIDLNELPLLKEKFHWSVDEFGE